MLTAIPRTYFQVNELITSLMLNYVALLALNYAVFGPWKDPKGFNFPGSPMFTAAQSLPTFGATRLHFGIVFAIIAVLLYAFMIRYTRWGYELRLIGANAEAARNAGIRISRHVLVVMIISGGVAGLAGMSEVSGVAHRLMYGISPGYGYTAIIVAWLAKLNPVGLVDIIGAIRGAHCGRIQCANDRSSFIHLIYDSRGYPIFPHCGRYGRENPHSPQSVMGELMGELGLKSC